VPGGSPPGLFIEFVSLLECLLPRLDVVEELEKAFLKEKDFLNDGSSIYLHQILDDEVILRGPTIHILQEPPFVLPDLFLEILKACLLQLPPKLKQSILEVSVDLVHHMKVIILDENTREDLLNRFRKGTPQIKDNGPGLKAKPFNGFEKLHHLAPPLRDSLRLQIKNLPCLGI